MIIDCISDLHGFNPSLKGGDLLIVAGDLAKSHELKNYFHFFDWLDDQDYKKKVVIAGNHDVLMEKESYEGPVGEVKDAFVYLKDSLVEFEGLKIWGSPWSKRFEGMNPKCMAFTKKTDEDLSKKWKLIPQDIDILITHEPPYSILDQVGDFWRGTIENVGSKSLLSTVLSIKPKLHVFGHIHEKHGQEIRENIRFVNASIMNERYKPVNEPIRIEL